MEDLIKEVLLDSMKVFDDKCFDFIEKINQFDFLSTGYRNIVDEYCKKMNNYSEQIGVHMNLEKTDVVSINFYDVFNSFFNSGAYQKEVEYYLQQGFGKDVELVTDEEVLRREFVFPYCFHSMMLVPLNIASNARKYMLSGGKVTVTLTNDESYKYITIVNMGPLTENAEDIGEFKRGENSSYMSGMGLGLSQVKSVVMMHKSLLDASFSAKSAKTTTDVNGLPYSEYITTLSYNTIIQDAKLQVLADEFKKRIPLIILHNMGEIVANILSATKKLFKIHYKGDLKWRRFITYQIANINYMQDVMKTCLYSLNGFSTDYLLGNKCDVDIAQAIKDCMYVFTHCEYQLKELEVDIQGTLNPIESYSALYSIIWGACDLICKSIQSQSHLEVNLEQEKKEIIFLSEDADFTKYFSVNEKLRLETKEDLPSVRIQLYKDLLKELSADVRITKTSIVVAY